MPRCQLVIKIIVMIKIQFQNSDKESWKQTTNENISCLWFGFAVGGAYSIMRHSHRQSF
jgi:hypothetical protein